MAKVNTTPWLADIVGEFIHQRGPSGATAAIVRQYCTTPSGHYLTRSQVNRALQYLWINGWTPKGKHHRVTRTRIGNGQGSIYVMGTHATKQQQDDAVLSRLLEMVTRCERDARQADIRLETNPGDLALISLRSGHLNARRAHCSTMRLLLASNPHYAGPLTARAGLTPGVTLYDEVMAS